MKRRPEGEKRSIPYNRRCPVTKRFPNRADNKRCYACICLSSRRFYGQIRRRSNGQSRCNNVSGRCYRSWMPSWSKNRCWARRTKGGSPSCNRPIARIQGRHDGAKTREWRKRWSPNVMSTANDARWAITVRSNLSPDFFLRWRCKAKTNEIIHCY